MHPLPDNDSDHAECVGSGSGAWWRRRRPAPVTSADQVVVVAALNSSTGGHVGRPGGVGGSATLVLPSTMSRSAGSSPGVTKPAGASPLVPSCRSAFSVTSRGVMPTSPYSDSAAVDHQRQVTSVKQMAQLFEEASSWQRDVGRQHHLGVDVLTQSRQLAAERHYFAVNSQLFFFPTSPTTTTTTTETSPRMSGNNNATVGRHGDAQQWHKNSTDLRLGASGATGCVSGIKSPVTVNPLEFRGIYSATSNSMKLVHWPLMVRLLHLVQRGGDWSRCPPRPLLAVPNVTAHPSMASVPITVLLYNGPLLCGFNEAIKGLTLILLYTLYTLHTCTVHVIRSATTLVGAVAWSSVGLACPVLCFSTTP